MLKPAQLYAEELTRKFLEVAYNEDYMFYNSGWMNKYIPSEDTWHMHEFVSIYNGEVIGYISYDIDQRSQNVTNFRMINFTNNKCTFALDIIKVLHDIFYKYSYNKINFGAYVGSPAEKIYDKFINKYGGRVIGTYEMESKLLDGRFYDFKIYEIMNKYSNIYQIRV